MPAEKKKIWEKTKGHIRERRKTWFEVAGVRVVTRLREIFMVSHEEVHPYLRLPLDDSWGIVLCALSNRVPAHSPSWSFPHEHEESLYGRDDSELRGWESNLLDKSLASNIELLCKSKIRQG